MKKEIKITSLDRRKYVFDNKKDEMIFKKSKKLESKKLDRRDKEVIKLIITQLKKDWRNPLISYLNKLLKKYK